MITIFLSGKDEAVRRRAYAMACHPQSSNTRNIRGGTSNNNNTRHSRVLVLLARHPDSCQQKHMAHPTAYKSHTIHVDRFSVSLAVHLAASWAFSFKTENQYFSWLILCVCTLFIGARRFFGCFAFRICGE